MTRNGEVAALLEEFADRLEAMDVEYKPRAYRRAAESVRASATDIEALAAEGQDAVEEIEGVGDAISSKIVEYFEHGEIDELEELRAELPVDIDALTAVEGVGPKTVGDLYEALDVRDLDDLEAAAREGRIQEVEGYGAKTEENILEAIPFARQSRERALLGDARPVADRLLEYLRGREAVERAETGGSLRRWRPTVGDVDVLVASESGEAAVEAFVDWGDADEVIEAGETKASVRSNGMRVDLRVAAPEEFGAALQYFTGSRDHNVRVRNRAIERDLKMNEYGVFDVSGVDDPDSGEGTDGSRTSSEGSGGRQRVGERVAGETEEGMYEVIDLPWIAPEMREDRGEVDAADAGELPDLVAVDDVRGDLHTHTDWSDGKHSIEEMLEAAAAFGHDYYAVADHATGPGIVGGVGLSDEELLEQVGEVRDAAEGVDVEVFTGVEANLDTEGGLNVGDDALDELDVVVASPHAALDGDGTDRIVAAIEHPETNVVGHPTGRTLNQRPGMSLDFETVGKAAAEHDVALEINSYPSRLDLRGAAVKTVIEEGATVAIDTDAHAPVHMEFLRYGVHTARRGWAEPDDVLNTRDVEGIREFLGL
jgi:DNA polymerase (family 10)